jgi:uncharacterized protein YjbI with pentapeptide repeats
MNTEILNETQTSLPQSTSLGDWANWSHLTADTKFNLKKKAFSKAKGKNAEYNKMQLLQKDFTNLDLTDSDLSG